MISKELLNRNRVLTMSNNRKCNYIVVDAGRESTTIMGINTQNNTKDIVVLKVVQNKKLEELVNEVYWICREHDAQIVLSDCLGCGMGFIDMFKAMIKQEDISIREIDGRKIFDNDIFHLINQDLQSGKLRFLQMPEIANTYYSKPFLGYSNIMQYHKETDELINEINNIELKIECGNVKLNKINKDIGSSRAMCLFIYYSYSCKSILSERNKEYELKKRMSQYCVNYGTLYKYMFKCIENEKIEVIFYGQDRNKFQQFENIVNEEEYQNIFGEYLSKVTLSKDNFEIRLHNDSRIRFIVANDNSRGCRYHYAVVDTNIDREIYDNVVIAKGVLFDFAKRENKLSDNYNMEFIEM